MDRCAAYPNCPGHCDGWPNCMADCAGAGDCPPLCQRCRLRYALTWVAVAAAGVALIVIIILEGTSR